MAVTRDPVNIGSPHILTVPLDGVSGWEEAEHAVISAVCAYTGWPSTGTQITGAMRDSHFTLELRRDGRWYGEARVKA